MTAAFILVGLALCSFGSAGFGYLAGARDGRAEGRWDGYRDGFARGRADGYARGRAARARYEASSRSRVVVGRPVDGGIAERN